AVPGEGLRSGIERCRSGVGRLARRARNRDVGGAGGGRVERPRGGTVRRVGERRGVAGGGDRAAEKLQRRGGFRCLLQRDQGLHVGVHIDLLFDRGEFDELLGELIGVERVERVLVL